MNRQTAHYRALAEQAVMQVPPYPENRFAGRGIVICASGLR